MGVNSESVCDQAGDFKEPKAKHRAIAQISDTRCKLPFHWLLDESIVRLPGPLPRQELNDRRPAGEKLREWRRR